LVKYSLPIVFICFLSFIAKSQTYSNVSARSIALASNVATLNDVTVIQMNPSVLSTLQTTLFSMQNVSILGFMDVQKNAVTVGVPLQKGGVGFSIQSFGNKVYRVITGGVSYAFHLSESLSFGVFLGNKNLSIQQYGSKNALDISFAMQGKLNNVFAYGMSVQSLGLNNKEIQSFNPTIVYLGTKYTPELARWRLFLELEKSLISPVRLKVACVYYLTPSFVFRSGIMTSSYQLSSGIGWSMKKKVRMDVGASWQAVLGVSLQFGVVFSTKPTLQHEE